LFKIAVERSVLNVLMHERKIWRNHKVLVLMIANYKKKSSLLFTIQRLIGKQ